MNNLSLCVLLSLGLAAIACGEGRPGFGDDDFATGSDLDAGGEEQSQEDSDNGALEEAGAGTTTPGPLGSDSGGATASTTPEGEATDTEPELTPLPSTDSELSDAGAFDTEGATNDGTETEETTVSEPTDEPSLAADAGAPDAPKAQLGERCELSEDCEQGHCADGVCCSTACDQVCARCDDPAQLGTCTAASSDDACTAPACPPDSECRQHEPVADAPSCAAIGQCVTQANCEAVDAESGAPCGQNAAGMCDGEGQCVVPNKATLGQTCTAADQCGSGFCAATPTGAMVCCDAACSGICSACSATGRCDQKPADDTECAAIECDPSDECTTYPAALTANRCAAFGQCVTEASHCEPEFEAEGTECGPSSVCDGAGQCELSCPTTTGPNRTCTEECPCGAGEGVCTSDDDCDDGLVCTPDAAGKLGFPGSSCLPQHCVNNQRDSGESSVDCGAGCGCRATYEVVQINQPRDTTFQALVAMSGDGSVFAGNLVRDGDWAPVRVTSAGSVTELQRFGAYGEAFGISGDGTTVVGALQCSDPPACATDYPGRPFRWSGTSDPTAFYNFGVGRLVSATGSVVGGTYYDNDLQREVAFRVGTNQSRMITDFDAVAAMSADGQVILGRPPQSTHWEVWSQATESLVSLTQPLSWTSSNLTAINEDGSVIAGWSWEPAGYSYFLLRNGTFTVLPEVSEGMNIPRDLSANGTRLVGELSGGVQTAFIWDEAGGARSVVDECEDRGLELPADLSLNAAHFLSDDGRVIVGYMYGATTPSFWRVTLLD